MTRMMIHNRQFLRVRSTGSPLPCGTLLYIHGLGESGLCFDELIANERLSEWNHVVPDLIGYGRSHWPEGRITLEDHADSIGEIAGRKLARPLILLGHSMGGVIGQILCEKRPSVVDGFFNVEGNISLRDCKFSLRAAGQSSIQFSRQGFDELSEWVYMQGVRQPAYRRYFASLMMAHPETFHLNGRELVEVSRKENLAERFRSLPFPSRYLGGLDGGISVRSLELLRRAGVDRALLERAGHWPFIDRPQAFVDELLKFTMEVECEKSGPT